MADDTAALLPGLGIGTTNALVYRMGVGITLGVAIRHIGVL